LRHSYDEETGEARPFRSGYVNAVCEGETGVDARTRVAASHRSSSVAGGEVVTEIAGVTAARLSALESSVTKSHPFRVFTVREVDRRRREDGGGYG
jgi:hypothetical protein